ncbi:MAG: hypothetical protein ACRDPK_06220, partial [Carbonactinosporaceae bacterium]
AEEVAPALKAARAAGAGLDLRDVQVYATALALRDGLGQHCSSGRSSHKARASAADRTGVR